MNAEYINLFISAVTQVFEEVTQKPLKIGNKSVRGNNTGYGKNVIVFIGITQQVRGSVTLSMDVEYAKEVASKMMFGVPVSEFDDMPQSAIREMTNMMMGRVASLFEKLNVIIDITPPTLMVGEGLKVSNEVTPTLVLGFDDESSNNVIELDIALREVR